jgi:AcrR family transcriptional regulator
MTTSTVAIRGRTDVPRRKLPMRKITEVLRLKAAGISIRDIAARVGASRTTVFEYLARAEAAPWRGSPR